MLNEWVWSKGASLPAGALWWVDDTGALVDFTSGWTFVAKVGADGGVPFTTKSTGFTGAAGSGDGSDPSDVPNLVVNWSTSDLSTPGTWTVEITATRTSDSAVRRMKRPITIQAVMS